MIFALHIMLRFVPNIVPLSIINKKTMTRIGLLSDTHAFWDDKYLKYFENCDEIWHAGDIGSVEVARKLSAFRPFRAVYGNIDGQDIRRLYPQTNRFTVDGAEVLIKHIGGYPGNYDPSIRGSLLVKPPQLFISGHSHILKVKYDKTLDMLHINPGAAGISGFHKVRTLVRFCIANGDFKDLEVRLSKNNTIISFDFNNKVSSYMISNNDDFNGKWNDISNNNLILKYYNNGKKYIWFRDNEGNISNVISFDIECLNTSKSNYDKDIFYCNGSTVYINSSEWIVLSNNEKEIMGIFVYFKE